MQAVIDSEKSAIARARRRAAAQVEDRPARLRRRHQAADRGLGSPADAESAAKTMAIDTDVARDAHAERGAHRARSAGGGAQGRAQAHRRLLRRHRRRHGSAHLHVDRQARQRGGRRHRHHRLQRVRSGASCARSASWPSSRSAWSASARRRATSPTTSRNVIDEIKKQYVATFEVPLAGGDGKAHTFQALGVNNGRDAVLDHVNDKVPKREPSRRRSKGDERLALVAVAAHRRRRHRAHRAHRVAHLPREAGGDARAGAGGGAGAGAPAPAGR